MPYARQTLSQLLITVENDITSYMGGVNPQLRFSNLNVMSRVFAALLYTQTEYLDYISKQAIPVTSTNESLMAWAALKGLQLTPAAAAMGTVQFTGAVGALVTDGTILIRSDGELYEVPIGYGGSINNSGVFNTTIVSATPGNLSNLTLGSPAQTLSTQIPINGVLSTVTLTSSLTGGADVETQASLLARLIQLFSNPPQGGALQDYVTWGLGFPGVTRVWVAGPSIMGAGTVTVYFAMDSVELAFNGIPQGTNGGSEYENRISTAAGDQLHLANYLYPLRPATAIVWSMAPVAEPLNLTLAEVPADATIRADITAALASFLIREATVGGTINADLTAGGTVRISQLWDAINQVPGLDFFEIVSPTADVTVATGQLSTPGSITYD
jgi:uncharacterized phage protein gp47/JayE